MGNLLWVIVALCLAGQGNSADKLICTVSRNGDKTTYTISADPGAPIIDMSTWDFTWINGTNFTIAANSGQIPPVLNSNISSLTTSKCLEVIVSTVSENTGAKYEYRTICKVNCSSKDLDHGEEGGHSMIWTAVTVTVVVVLVLAGLAFLCYKMSRKSNGGQCGGRYLTVKMKPDPTTIV